MNRAIFFSTIIALTLASQPVFSESTYELADCSQPNSHNIILKLKNNNEVSLPADQKTCDSSFMYDISPDGTTTILAGPGSDELGPNAQNEVYIIHKDKEETKHIGSIPVSANPIQENQFKDISQSGGSVFESIYHIKNDKIELDKESLELIFSDTQCVLDNENSKQCKNIPGTYANPICIMNSNGKKVLQEKSRCADLVNEIEPQ